MESCVLPPRPVSCKPTPSADKEPAMTWSIVAKDPATGRFAVAVTTCAFAVGARVPYGCGGVGAIATQSFVNPFIGVDRATSPG